MKELSIEEKAKAYDEAIERARLYKGLQAEMSVVFPELKKESEDERIRKYLIKCVEENVFVKSFANNGFDKQTILAYLKKQGEQKSADKSEPKFKVEEGKWYICISQFCNCIEGRVYKATSDNRIIDDFGTEYDMHSDAYKYFRLWTIQDAKDGDVLAIEPIEGYYSPFVAIYKKQNEEDFDSYCFIGFDGKFYKAENGHSTEEVYPATKEQRDTLMKAMADDGYKWDDEKKELNKIEQRPTWGEEDEEKINEIIDYLDYKGHKTDVEFLKSLKERYT